jgi:hypothetical protein
VVNNLGRAPINPEMFEAVVTRPILAHYWPQLPQPCSARLPVDGENKH